MEIWRTRSRETGYVYTEEPGKETWRTRNRRTRNWRNGIKEEQYNKQKTV